MLKRIECHWLTDMQAVYEATFNIIIVVYMYDGFESNSNIS